MKEKERKKSETEGDNEISWKQVFPMFLVCGTIILMWGVWTVDLTISSIITITGIPGQLGGQSLILERVGPRTMYHLGLLGIMGSYILTSALAVAGWMRR